MNVLGRFDDEEVFKNFDWSTFFYTRLFNSLKTILQEKKEAYKLKRAQNSKAVTYYNIKGYVLAFQVIPMRTKCIGKKSSKIRSIPDAMHSALRKASGIRGILDAFNEHREKWFFPDAISGIS
ncbi:Ulp1-like peptidase [Cucumis melo var. makuwa]|uniref:Ulp1-like peptidase n=1 Tax=Cucumis melo var. makuwa TaxID=1194695 RepID=A0A5A7VI77_CUCMM|nr:Ulp1-like peptidase [Cucumis melo var. makuwa]TYK26300.1 Ulp1-like peptidase [Cucumis melo var. makuwa]